MNSSSDYVKACEDKITAFKKYQASRLLPQDMRNGIGGALKDSRKFCAFLFEKSRALNFPSGYGYSVLEMAFGIPPMTVGQAIVYLKILKKADQVIS